MDKDLQNCLIRIKGFENQDGYYLIDYQKFLDNNNEENLNMFITCLEEGINQGYLIPPANESRQTILSKQLYRQLKLTPTGEKFLESKKRRGIINFFIDLLKSI